MQKATTEAVPGKLKDLLDKQKTKDYALEALLASVPLTGDGAASMLHHPPAGWLRQIKAGQVFLLAEWEVYTCMALGLPAPPSARLAGRALAEPAAQSCAHALRPAGGHQVHDGWVDSDRSLSASGGTCPRLTPSWGRGRTQLSGKRPARGGLRKGLARRFGTAQMGPSIGTRTWSSCSSLASGTRVGTSVSHWWRCSTSWCTRRLRWPSQHANRQSWRGGTTPRPFGSSCSSTPTCLGADWPWPSAGLEERGACRPTVPGSRMPLSRKTAKATAQKGLKE
eukprot:2082837-Rhodomonas_salina.1